MGIRYLDSFKVDINKDPKYDVIIIGSGIAGLYSAISLDSHLKVLVVTKDTIYETNSNLAQGGIAACMEDSDYTFHVNDTLKAGCYYNLPEAVEVIVREGKDNINKLIELGVNFDKTPEGKLKATLEGGHSHSRILHAKDATGREVIRALSEVVRDRNNIDVMEFTNAIDLITSNEKCVGVLLQKNDKVQPYLSKNTVLATGGIGQLYQNSTNSIIASGDGIAMAYRAGVKITDMEFIQFHPTALYTNNNDRNFLISEAVRGEGAILRNIKGEAFMVNYHELKDLAPRDIVSRAIINEISKSDEPYIYLDITHLDSDFIKNRFPNIYNECLTHGVDITCDFIPVCPVQHYLMGGIETDLNAKTSMKGLYACGESAKTGSHGANRLASNSLLEALVFGKRAADSISSDKLDFIINGNIESDIKQTVSENNSLIYLESITDIKKLMTERVFIYRKIDDLEYAKEKIKNIKEKLEKIPSSLKEFYKAYNMAIIAELVINAALNRHDSIGSHTVISEGEL